MNRDNSILFDDLGPLHFPALIYIRFGVQGVPLKIAFFTFGPKKVCFFAPVSPRVKIFQFLHWNLINHI